MSEDLISIPPIKFPLLGDRVQSTFIDTMLIIISMFVISAVLDRFDNVPDWVRISLFVGIWLVYDPLCTALGCTLGNYVKGLRVRQHNDTTKKINIVLAVFRYIIKVSLGWISFLTINSNSEKRAIHDFIAGSVVIKI
jgi:uncharacterized RDD family membrane protein YckC